MRVWRDRLAFLPFAEFVAWCSTLCIVLNVYNGDVLPIHENLEYALWHAVPLGATWLWDQHTLLRTLTRHHVLLFGVCCNVFWYYESPFHAHRTIRHRTEYYDTQGLLCAMLYCHMLCGRQEP